MYELRLTESDVPAQGDMDVREITVGGVSGDKWGEVIAAFIRPAVGKSLDAGVLRAHCRQHLAPQKTPVIWCALDRFPQTGSGKIQKYRLRNGYLAGDHPALQ